MTMKEDTNSRLLLVKDISEQLAKESGKSYEHVLNMVVPIYFQAPLTLAEIGILFDMTRERVRQIEDKAKRKLAHPRTARTLKLLLLDVLDNDLKKEYV